MKLKPSFAVAAPDPEDRHVVGRLRWRIQDATQMGFHVRTEPLDGRQADWCQIGARRFIFLDLTQSAIEQLSQLEEVLLQYQSTQGGDSTEGAGQVASLTSTSQKAA